MAMCRYRVCLRTVSATVLYTTVYGQSDESSLSLDCVPGNARHKTQPCSPSFPTLASAYMHRYATRLILAGAGEVHPRHLPVLRAEVMVVEAGQDQGSLPHCSSRRESCVRRIDVRRG